MHAPEATSRRRITAAAITSVLIIYGGYSAQDVWVQRWCDPMIRAKHAGLGVGDPYAVKGPNAALSTNHQIDNSKLAAHLAAESRAQDAGYVAVIAHSSGTFVADELFAVGQLLRSEEHRTVVQTGMREGELAGLLWEDVDLGRRMSTCSRASKAENTCVEPPVGPSVMDTVEGRYLSDPLDLELDDDALALLSSGPSGLSSHLLST